MPDFASRLLRRPALHVTLAAVVFAATCPPSGRAASPSPSALSSPLAASPTPTPPIGSTLFSAPQDLTVIVPSTPAATPTPTPADFHPPKLIKRLPVRYPETAHLNRAEGTVRVRFGIDENGHVDDVFVIHSSGSLFLDALVRDYELRQWTFEPATLGGKPVPGMIDEEFEFHLDPAEERALAQKRLAAPIGLPDAPYPKEAAALKVEGTCTIGVKWTKGGLVDFIHLVKSSGSNVLDRTALRFAYENWRVDPKDVTDKEFTKSMAFKPPLGPNDTLRRWRIDAALGAAESKTGLEIERRAVIDSWTSAPDSTPDPAPSGVRRNGRPIRFPS